MKKLIVVLVMVSMLFSCNIAFGDESPERFPNVYFMHEDDSVSEEYRSGIYISEQGDFTFMINLLTALGSMEGEYEREGNIVTFNVFYVDFEEFSGGGVKTFKMKVNGNKLSYITDESIGDIDKGSSFTKLEDEAPIFATFREMSQDWEEEEDVVAAAPQPKQPKKAAGPAVYTIEFVKREHGVPGYVISAPLPMIQKEFVGWINIQNPDRLRNGCKVQITSGKNNLGTYNTFVIKGAKTSVTAVNGIVID